MKLREALKSWRLTSLKLSFKVLELEWSPTDQDREAAWDLYVELITRVTTQRLAPDEGDEAAALESLHAVFAHTRIAAKTHGRRATEFLKIAAPVLNQVLRPFTSKWHRVAVQGGLQEHAQNAEFRQELSQVQDQLGRYTHALADIAGVEDLSGFEANG